MWDGELSLLELPPSLGEPTLAASSGLVGRVLHILSFPQSASNCRNWVTLKVEEMRWKVSGDFFPFSMRVGRDHG